MISTRKCIQNSLQNRFESMCCKQVRGASAQRVRGDFGGYHAAAELIVDPGILDFSWQYHIYF